jgi:hypothetical protein
MCRRRFIFGLIKIEKPTPNPSQEGKRGFDTHLQ